MSESRSAECVLKNKGQPLCNLRSCHYHVRRKGMCPHGELKVGSKFKITGDTGWRSRLARCYDSKPSS